MSSPGLTVTVAVAPLPLLVAEPQSTLVSVQPLVEPSVTDFEPSWLEVKVNVFWLGLVASAALVSRLKLASTPELALVYGKESEPELAGSVTFLIVSLASFLLV